MPAMKQEGYAKDATALQRIIRRLSEDASSDPAFCERNIRRLQEAVADFTDHSAKRARDRTQPRAPVKAKGNGASSAVRA